MSLCSSTAFRACARWAAAWAASSTALSNCSRWTARIDAAQAWIVLRQAARVVSRALCLLSRTPRAHSPRAWISSAREGGNSVTRSAYGGVGPALGPRRQLRPNRRCGREVPDLGPALHRQALQPPEADQVGG